MGRNLLICLFIAIVVSINATVITEWNFETQSLTPSTGNGSISRIGGIAHDTFNGGYGGSSFAWSTTNYPAQSTNNLTGGIKIEVSTIGFTDIYFTWVTRHSNTSANREVLFYTLDKTAAQPVWVQSGIYDAAAGDTWFAWSFDGRSIPGLNDNANLAFKIVSAFSNAANTQYMPSTPTSTYAPTGKWRFDNISIWAITTSPTIGLIFNEVCSDNDSGILDYYNEHSDWIELKNNTASNVNLNSYCLSDDPSEPLKWRFPAGSNLQPGQIILIWASGRDLTDPIGEFHTNFAIASGGESLLLTIFSQVVIADQMPYTVIPDNMSYGRLNDNMDWFYFTQPTPRSENTTFGYTAILSDPTPTLDSGYFPTSAVVDFNTSQPGSEIHYTTDGSVPTENSPIWTGPQTLYNRSSEPNNISMIPTILPNLPPPVSELDWWFPPTTSIPKIHVMRTRCFAEGSLPSDTVTRTYMVGISLYELPIVSVIMDSTDLFDPDVGIYVAGNGYNGSSFYTANFMQNWDRPAYTDWFDVSGSHVYQKAVEVEIHGTYSARAGMKSLRLKTSGEEDDRLDFAFFGPDYQSSFKDLLLRNSGNDVHKTLFRDYLIEGIMKQQNLTVANFKPYIVFLNGEYWGVHSLQERMSECYISEHFGLPVSDLDVLEKHWQVDCGDNLDYSALINYVSQNNASEPAVWQYLETKIDMQNLREYMAAQIIAGNTDWPGNNNRYWRKRVPFSPNAPYGQDGRWRWLVYDMDYSFGLYQNPYWTHNTLSQALDPLLGWRTILMRSLIQNQGFKFALINTIADRLNYTWQSSRIINSVNQIEDQIETSIPQHILRWSMPSSMSLWRGEVNALRTFATNRPAFLRNLVVNQFGLAGTANVILQITPPEAAVIRMNDTVDLSSGSYTYFQGVPIALKAFVNIGWQIVSFNGQSSDSLYINPVQSQTIQLVLRSMTPQNLSIQRLGSQVILNWDTIPEADGYRVEYSSAPDSAVWETLQTLAGNSLLVNMSGQARFYRVRAVYN